MNQKILIIATITLLVDQASKAIIETILSLNEEFTIIKNFFSFHYINNYGAAWSILNNHTVFLILLSLFALLLIYHFMYLFKTNKRNNIAFGLVTGGLVGNLIDRWIFGYVRDFLSFRIFSYNYPVFNIADTAIVIGMGLLLYAVWKGEDHHEQNHSDRK